MQSIQKCKNNFTKKIAFLLKTISNLALFNRLFLGEK
ncbi:unknown protein [Waddlia chondrophila 2032/99]|uniref:Uncharacterized protein n=1 Tax=Waddlia chondrophila 2032/99 TaxID=765953 RepID=F8LAS8_9BACT|nr:unknown protein [Waddlia chondrophila 2032/99]